MDVDVATLGEDERCRLSKEGRCFHCKQQGHMLKDCPKQGQTLQGSREREQTRKTNQTPREAPPKYERARETAARVEEVSEEDAKGPEKKTLKDIKALSKEQRALLQQCDVV